MVQITSLTERQLKKLPQLNISSKIINTEARLYIENRKRNYSQIKELLKIFYNQSNEYLSDKVYVIGKLMALFEELEMPELVLPTSLVAINGKVSGYSMPWIEDNINLSLILNNPRVKVSEKLKYLKEILQILINLRSNPELRDKFYLGDIHEANFIFDIDEQIVKVVDLDSCYFSGGPIPISKFTTYNDKLFDKPDKYVIDLGSDKVIPNDQTTSLSFLLMLLNSLSGEKAYRWNYEEYYQYISDLKRLGFPSNILNLFLDVYTNGKLDIFDPELLDGIDPEKSYNRSLKH